MPIVLTSTTSSDYTPLDYTTLKNLIAGYLNRSDLTDTIDTFIDLCESEMQAKFAQWGILDFDASASITITAGAGTLPTGWVGARSLLWSGNLSKPIKYVTPDVLYSRRAQSAGTVASFTVVGSQILTDAAQDGTLTGTYKAKFTPLDDTTTTNAVLNNHPGAYLYGSLVHGGAWLKDPTSASSYRALFDASLEDVKALNSAKKFTGPMAVRPA